MKPAAGLSIIVAAMLVSLALLSPSRALADELPKDTNQIESLTPEQAKTLLAEFKGQQLDLNGLTTLDADTAKALAEFKSAGLLLDGVTTLDADTTKPLAEFKGDFLSLSRARCTSCGQDFVVAFSCKGRGVCPSCNGRRMAQAAAHLVDRVTPPVSVRQWVISVPKRLRCFLADRPSAVAALTRIFISRVERLLCTAAGSTRDGHRSSATRPRLGAVSFLRRFGSALNHHVHLHACATDGVFVPTRGGPPALLRASRLP